MILPGITSTSDENYVKDTANEFMSRGYKVVVYVDRFVSPEVKLKIPIKGHIDKIKDIRNAI